VPLDALRLSNIWLTVNVGGSAASDKPSIINLSVSEFARCGYAR
jgi:hypothetical protein